MNINAYGQPYPGKRLRDRNSSADNTRGLYAPLAIIAASLLIQTFHTFMFSLEGLTPFVLTCITSSLSLSAALTVTTILLLAKRFHFPLGRLPAALPTATLKLIAISLGTDAALSLTLMPLRPLPGGFLLSLLFTFVTFYALIAYLFDLDEHDKTHFVKLSFLAKLTTLLTLTLFADFLTP